MVPQFKKLFLAATRVRKNAHAPYSKYRVGAAVLTTHEKIFSGCNVENASYGLCQCAERNALATAVAAGHKKFKKILIVSQNGCTPCGACRQVIWELCGDIPVIVCDQGGKLRTFTSRELLPEVFDVRDLAKK